MDVLISTMAIHFYINPYFDDYVSFLQLKRIQVQHGYTILMVMPILWIQFQGTHGFRLKDWVLPGISCLIQGIQKAIAWESDWSRPVHFSPR